MRHTHRLRHLRPELAMLAAAALLLCLHPASRAALVLASVGGLLLVLRQVHPTSHARAEEGLQKLGQIVAFVISLVAMMTVFFLVLTPTALLLRCSGRDPLHTGRNAIRHASLWQAPHPRPYNDNFFRAQF